MNVGDTYFTYTDGEIIEVHLYKIYHDFYPYGGSMYKFSDGGNNKYQYFKTKKELIENRLAKLKEKLYVLKNKKELITTEMENLKCML